MAAIPPELKIKLLESNINNYNDAITRAQSLQEMYVEANVLHLIQAPSTSTTNNLILEDISKLKETVNAMSVKETFTPHQGTSTSFPKTNPHNQRNQHTFRKRHNFKPYRKQQFSNNRGQHKFHNFQHTPRTLHQQFPNFTCHYCGKSGHVMKNCFHFKNICQNLQRFNNPQTAPIHHVNTNQRYRPADFQALGLHQAYPAITNLQTPPPTENITTHHPNLY